VKFVWVLVGIVVGIAGYAGYRYLPNYAHRASVVGTLASPPGPPGQANKPESTVAPAFPGTDRIWTAGKDDVPVIMYHDVVRRKKDVWFDLTAREFEAQMQAIKDAGATVVPLSDVVDHLKTGKMLPAKAIALTFDDNTLGIYEYAYPIMKRFGYHSTQFVHTGKVGITTVKEHCTWDQLREMQDSGLVEIGSHTVDHPADLRALTPEEVTRQLTESKSEIESQMGRPCRYFAYTEGNGDESTAQIVADAGYEAAWNEARAWDAAPCDRLFMARFAPFRLEDILAHWKEEDGRVRTIMAGTTLKPATAVAPHTENAGGMSFTITNAAWSSLPRRGRRSSSLGEFSAPNIVLDSSAAYPVPEARQWDLAGRPLVVAGASSAYVLAYQPWIGELDQSVKVLLPDANFAIVGVEQLLHEGTSVDPVVWRRGAQPATFIGWKADGTPVLGRTKRLCRREALVEGLQALGMKEAVLLGR
jgi:peptidoglycan/xylan/chitin deacetylase (PgdA/CDA1 family)